MRPSVGRKSGVHRWSAANVASRFLPASSSSPNAYCRSSVEKRRAARASGIYPRSPSPSFSNDDASASSFVPESVRSSTGIAARAENLFERAAKLHENLQDVASIACLVPNFTEERVKRFARILELNESLIDDLWQLAV